MMEVGIKGEIHDLRLIWAQHSQEEELGFILVDAWNTFNEDNQTAML